MPAITNCFNTPTTMTKRKPCRVEITQVTHKDNVGYSQKGYIVSIDKPGSPVPYKLMDAHSKRVKRYSARKSAKRGALRNLKAFLHSKAFNGAGVYAYGAAPKITFIQFVFTTSKRKR